MWTGLSLGVTPGADGAAGARLGTARRSLRPQDHGRAVAGQLRRADRGDGVRHARVARARAARRQGLFAGYGSLSVAMAAESAPRDRMPSAIGAVQTAQRLGRRVGPLIGGVLAGLVGLRRAFLVTSMFYAIGLVLVHLALRRPRDPRRPPADTARDRPRDVPQRAGVRELRADDVRHLRAAVRRPQLRPGAAAVGRAGRRPHDRVPLVSGVLFSIMAFTGALGHHFCGRLLRRYTTRVVIAGGAACAACRLRRCSALSGNFWLMCAASALFGLGIGAAMTAAYTAAGARDPAGRARHRLRRPDERVARRHGEQPVHCRVPRRRVASASCSSSISR